VKDATGSAFLDLGKTKIISSVYGPRKQERKELKHQNSLFVNLTFAPFSRKKRMARRQHRTQEETSLSTKVQEALSSSILLEDKFAVDIHIVILEDDGAILPGAITCATASLVSAGIGMKDITVGASAGIIGDKIVVDPSSQEEQLKNCNCIMEIAFSPNKNKIQFMSMKGSANNEKLQLLLSYCLEGSKRIRDLLKEKLFEFLENQVCKRAIE